MMVQSLPSTRVQADKSTKHPRRIIEAGGRCHRVLIDCFNCSQDQRLKGVRVGDDALLRWLDRPLIGGGLHGRMLRGWFGGEQMGLRFHDSPLLGKIKKMSFILLAFVFLAWKLKLSVKFRFVAPSKDIVASGGCPMSKTAQFQCYVLFHSIKPWHDSHLAGLM